MVGLSALEVNPVDGPRIERIGIVDMWCAWGNDDKMVGWEGVVYAGQLDGTKSLNIIDEYGLCDTFRALPVVVVGVRVITNVGNEQVIDHGIGQHLVQRSLGYDIAALTRKTFFFVHGFVRDSCLAFVFRTKSSRNLLPEVNIVHIMIDFFIFFSKIGRASCRERV